MYKTFLTTDFLTDNFDIRRSSRYQMSDMYIKNAINVHRLNKLPHYELGSRSTLKYLHGCVSVIRKRVFFIYILFSPNVAITSANIWRDESLRTVYVGE
jgi:hypothetical protein